MEVLKKLSWTNVLLATFPGRRVVPKLDTRHDTSFPTIRRVRPRPQAVKLSHDGAAATHMSFDTSRGPLLDSAPHLEGEELQ